jgi:tRNA(Ile)-lysidine synthase
VLVAVSGGLDSVVLLDLVAGVAQAAGLEPVVAHFDHGIHPGSAAVARQVERLAAGHGLRCIVGSLRLGAGASETRARTARYRWLRQTARQAGASCILLAHHADDQAETVLMRLLRGSGPAGLAGMPARRGLLVRPLLSYSRATLLRHARAAGLQWWEDPANHDARHLRSWLRQRILPQLSARLPGVALDLRRAGRQAAGDRLAWRAALRGWPGLGFRREGRIVSLDWEVLEALPAPLRLALAQALLREADGPAGSTRLRRALAALAAAPSGAVADLGRHWRLERAFSRLRLLPPARAGAPEGPLPLGGARGSAEWGEWRIRWAPESAPPEQPRQGSTAWFVPGHAVLRPWRPGDRLAPLGGRGRRLAVRCFQDARIPRTERAGWPLLEHDGELAWIPGICRSARQLPAPGQPALRVDVLRRG